MSGASRGLSGLVLGLALVGCLSAEGTRYEYFLAPGHEGAPGAQRWLLVPTNALAPVADFLIGPAERAQTGIQGRLEAAGRNVIPLPLSEALKVNSRVTAAGGVTGAAADALLSRLARELAATREVDVVAFSDLVIHDVMVQQGGYAAWNGVKRRQRLIRGKKTPAVYAFGRGQALSLRVRVFGSDGVKRFESLGGLDLIYEAKVGETTYQLQVRSDLLIDAEVLQTGISLALYPYLLESAPAPGDGAGGA